LVERPQNNASAAAVLAVALFSAALCALLVAYHAYLQKTMFAPFIRLKGFAVSLAAGDLNTALPMDQKNVFGAFSESFDILRAELKKSKEREIELEKSKKQLVAELSHDVKTPIASIKAVAEVLALRETDEKKLQSLTTIRQKAAEMDALVTDLFSSALADLTELSVTAVPLSSRDVGRIIKEADYLGKVGGVTIPDCLVLADPQRLSQIVGNILGNSYKYAGTEISVSAEIVSEDYTRGRGTLCNATQSSPPPCVISVEFRDRGGGVSDEELPAVANRFYRGKNSQGSAGAGLGLYICKRLLERMGGSMDCYNTGDGFAVKIFLKLA